MADETSAEPAGETPAGETPDPARPATAGGPENDAGGAARPPARRRKRSGSGGKPADERGAATPARKRPRRTTSAAKRTGSAGGRAGAAVPTAEDSAPTEGAAPPTEAAVPLAGDAPSPRRPGAVRRTLALRRAPRLRTGVAAFLVVAALLGVLVSALALWTHRVVYDTDAYVRVVAPVAQDPAARSALAGLVAAKAVQAVDLGDRLQSALPSTAKIAAPALTQALQRYLAGEIEKFLATADAQRLWVDANRFAHRQLISALQDQNRFVTVGHDDVRLDLLPLVAVALQKLEGRIPQLLGKDVTLPRIDLATSPGDMRTLLQDALGRELPPDFGTVTLLRGDTGYRAKEMLRTFDKLVVLAVVVTVVLVAAALLVSVRRRRTALWLGLGALLAFAAARVIEVRLERAAVGAIRSQGGAAVARAVLASAIGSLNGFLVWIAVAGVVVAVSAFLAGRPAWLDAVGRAFAHLFGVASDLHTPDTRAGRWLAGHLDLLRAAGVGGAVVVLLSVTGSLTAVIAVVLALVVYELALATYAAGIPRGPDAAGEEEAAGRDTEEPAA